MWRVGLLLCLVAGSRQLSITKFIVPNEVESGEDVTLQCEYELTPNVSVKELSVKWWWTSFDGQNRKQLYQRLEGHKADAIQSHIRIADNDNIVFQNITPAHSGTYECEVSNNEESRRHQNLTVYTMGSGPNLNLTTVEDGPDKDNDTDVMVSCDVTDVAPRPDLIISVNGKEIPVNESVSMLDDGFYDISATARLSDDDVNGAHVTCELTYTDTTVAHPRYIFTEIYNADPNEMTTTEVPDDPSTQDPTSIALENARDGGGRLAAYFFLVLSVVSFQIML